MKRTVHAIALIIPLVLVNIVAVYGQVAWARTNLHAGLAVALLFAGALESVGVYLAAEAHAALMAGDAALRLRLASYTVALIVGALNYQHWAGPGGSPTPAAVAFGSLSAISPWLWAVRSRSLRRADLRALGLIDPRTVRFSSARWLLHFGRTWRAFRLAVWAGETDPARAVALLDPPAPSPARPNPAPAAPERPVEPPAPPTAARARPARKRPGAAGTRPAGVDRAAAVTAVAAEYHTTGALPPTAVIAAEYGMSASWAEKVKAAAKATPAVRPVKEWSA